MFYIFMLFCPVLHFYIDFLHSWTSRRATGHKRASSQPPSLVLWRQKELEILYGWEIERV